EKQDFGAGTSANSLKIIHGGFRYLQHADLKRMRESIRERKILMRIAPHLVHPLPILVPVYGHRLRGREMMMVALFLNDLISIDRNHSGDPSKRIPRGRMLSRDECTKLLPGVSTRNLTGVARWYDAQAYNTERLVLSFLLSATEIGACVANYCEVIEFLREEKRVCGAKVRDRLTGDEFAIKAKMTINTGGAWQHQIKSLANVSNGMSPKLAKAINLVTRRIAADHAFGVSTEHSATDGPGGRDESRFYFIAPWREYSIVGTEYQPFQFQPDNLSITEDDVEQLIAKINAVYPSAKLTRDDVYFHHVGLVPAVEKTGANGSVTPAKHYRIYNHKAIDGLDGLLSVQGVKYTTARDVAEKTVDQVFRNWGMRPKKVLSRRVPIYGGAISNFDAYLEKEKMTSSEHLPPEEIERLIYNYGSTYTEIVEYARKDPDLGATLSESTSVLKAEVVHSVREEMAFKLSDVVFRRTELGTAGNPGAKALRECVSLMAEELEWDRRKADEELRETQTVFTCNG
ncbi:MAG: glycerol-3-phosphate dehydrogenase/oxidase, partial [bacterium]